MVSVVQGVAVQEILIKEPDKTSVTNTLDKTQPPSNISSSESSRSKRSICKYAASKQICPFGPKCRYRHPPTRPSKPVCRHYLHGNCRYGNRCKYRHPEIESDEKSNSFSPDNETPSTGILSFHDFPSISRINPPNQTPRFNQVPPTETTPISSSTERADRRVLHQHDGSRTAPVELQLEAFFKRAATITPKPHMAKPGKKTREKTTGTCMVVDKLTEIEAAELQLLKEEEYGTNEPRERTIHLLPFLPSDPQWDRHGNHTLQLIVTFPENYPQKPLSLKVIDEYTLPKGTVLAINTELDKQVTDMHRGAVVPSGHTPLFKNLLDWLDRNIMEICNDNNEESDSSSDSEGEGGEEEEEGETLDDSEFLRPSKRGTEVRLVELGLNKNVATLRLNRLKLTTQCTRCKNKEDVICSPEKRVSLACQKCQSCFGIHLHPDIVHPSNHTLGFMDILGCKPVDVVLPFCDFTVTCLECQKDSALKGLCYGEPSHTFCHRCHARLEVFTDSCKFIIHHAGLVDELAGEIAVTKKSKRGKDDLLIQEGKPLPELGTCVHYKKSHRWLRFPCCGKTYPCDVCHDQCEDHPMERANRMICGYCSKEQGYTGIRPCISCGSDLAHAKTSSYWEGGKGCRNKIKMKRNDPHKYKHDNKTVSKKDERVGMKGKNNRTVKTTISAV